MNEIIYGGDNGVKNKGKSFKDSKHQPTEKKDKQKNKRSEDTMNEDFDKESYIKAGKIAQELRRFTREIVKKGIRLTDIAKMIHDKTESLGADPAFPVNLSIDDVAAHYHPTLEDETIAQGLLKIDIGVHIDGFIADTALTIDLTDENIHKGLIDAAEAALKDAIKTLDSDPDLDKIGEAISDAITKKGFQPITNLSGHGLDRYQIHSGITIPNYANQSNIRLQEDQAYAIEPFATTGVGKIHEGPSSNIYCITDPKNTRSPSARKILEFVWNKYQTLPFSLRELQEKFGNIARLAIRELKNNGIVHEFPQLIEDSHAPVAQAEHTFIKTSSGIIVTTKEE